MTTIWTIYGIEKKNDVYKGEDYMEKLCESLRENKMNIINFRKRRMIPLTNKEYKSYLNQKSCLICKKCSKINTDKYRNNRK